MVLSSRVGQLSLKIHAVIISRRERKGKRKKDEEMIVESVTKNTKRKVRMKEHEE